MPIYEYDCPQCGTYEVTQRISDEPLRTHEACGQPVVKRISASRFQLKGGGWYADGYASKGGSGGSRSSGD